MKNRRLFLTSVAMVLLALLTHACKSLTPEEIRALWLAPENNRFKPELKMADKKIPRVEQSFLYTIGNFGVKDRIAMAYTKPGTVAVIQPGNKKLWVKYETAARSYALSTGERNATGTIDFNFEAGQSYMVDALWDEDRFIIITLDEAGIEGLCRRLWKDNSKQIQTGYGFETFEEYLQFQTQIWQVRKEETRKQLGKK